MTASCLLVSSPIPFVGRVLPISLLLSGTLVSGWQPLYLLLVTPQNTLAAPQNSEYPERASQHCICLKPPGDSSVSGQRIAVPGCDCPPHPRGNGFDLLVLEGTKAPGPGEQSFQALLLRGCEWLSTSGLTPASEGRGWRQRGGPQLGAESSSAGLTGLRLRLCRWIPQGLGNDSAPRHEVGLGSH